MSNIFLEYNSIYIYGAGNNGKKISKILARQNVKTDGFIDKFAPLDSKIDGIEIKRPFVLSPQIAKGTLVLVSVFNRDANIKDVHEYLLNLGFLNFMWLPEFIDLFYDDFGSHFWASAVKTYEYKVEDIKFVNDLLEDELSKKILGSTLKARLEKNPLLLPDTYPIEEQYFSEDIPLKPYSAFVDAGAFDGDSLPALNKHNPTLETYIAFEPDLTNFAKLSTTVNQKKDSFCKRAMLYPAGLSNTTEILKFSQGFGEGSCVSEQGETEVLVVALDHILKGIEIGYLKMDIEGAETDALLGSYGTICKQRPNLAICVYHKPEDLLHIPRLIASWNLNYKFYLRQYGYCGFDLVLYCIPE